MKLTICSAWILVTVFSVFAGVAPLLMVPNVIDLQTVSKSDFADHISRSSPSLIVQTISDQQAAIIGLMKVVHLLCYVLIVVAGINGLLIFLQYMVGRENKTDSLKKEQPVS